MNDAATTALLVAIVTSPAALGEKRYLSDVAASYGYSVTDAAFQRLLLNSWDEGLVRLSRADLVLDRAKVEASRIAVETEEFHYAELAE